MPVCPADRLPTLSNGMFSSKTTTTRDTVKQTQAQGSTIAAGNDVLLRATGAGADSDINVQGSQIKAGRNA
ncbi:hemagglutinin repeat-containing protein, partial [Pseudomonas cuatrocienegasensis]